MTEFEIASLGYAELNAWSTFAYATVSLLVGAAQCFLIWWGIRQMRNASKARDKVIDAQLRTLDAHTRALETLLKRAAPAGS